MAQRTGGEAIVQALTAHGVDTVFGIPGYQTYYLIDALARATPEIRLMTTRHEQGAGYMAFGYARATGRLGVCSVVPGPGVLNAASAIITAQSTATPMLCLVGEIPSFAIGKGIGLLHELPDQLGTLKTLCKHAVRVDRPADAPDQVAEAIRIAQSGRPGAVVVEMAMDVMARRDEVADDAGQPQAIDPGPLPDKAGIAAAVRLLDAARNPVIMAGTGAVPAAAEVEALATRLQAPVVTLHNARGVVSDRSPLGFTTPQGYAYWKQADLVLGIGSRLEFPFIHWGEWEDKKLIRIDIERAEINRFGPPTVGLEGDARQVVAALLEATRDLPERADRSGEFDALKAAVNARCEEVQPQMDYLKVIRSALPDDGFFVDEVTQVGYVSWYGFPVYRPRRFVSSGYQGNLGYGYATALGVKAANPDTPVVSIAGDGGFLFTGMELATAVKYGLGVVAIVFRNDAYGNVARDQNQMFEGRVHGTALTNPDFVALAQSFGARGERADSPAALARVLDAVLAENRPALIEVPLPEAADPWPPLFPKGLGGAVKHLISA
ncbi:MAG: hypothetical protein D6763_07265 [Alphaproteobacteria bacterium]|nr:MAG: hypothetical protein D6763_07265 [Alphaproteobacteria bacterium]